MIRHAGAVTIRKGEEWGSQVARPSDLRICRSDAELATAVAISEAVSLGVSNGDLHRTLGSPASHDRDSMQRLPVDLLRVTADGVALVAIAHVVARRSWWRGRIVAVMNTDHLGTWNLAPRAHPNDGRFDIVDVAPAMSLRDRLQARSRLPNGNHVPHPAITTRAVAAATWTFDQPMRLWIDGVRCGTVSHLEVQIEPDAFAILV